MFILKAILLHLIKKPDEVQRHKGGHHVEAEDLLVLHGVHGNSGQFALEPQGAGDDLHLGLEAVVGGVDHRGGLPACLRVEELGRVGAGDEDSFPAGGLEHQLQEG